MNRYADAVDALSIDLERYFAATVAELAGKMPAGQAIELGRASLHKIIDAAADRALAVRLIDVELESIANGGK